MRLSQSDRRIYSFDAMRGAAALLVTMLHIGLQHRQYVPGGYLAVDFFFVLSGFVVSQAYTAKLAAGMTIRSFVFKRAIRLYPMYFLGLTIGLAVVLGATSAGNGPFPGFGTIALNLIMLPGSPANLRLFPFNGPAWSLFFEVVANFVFVLVIWRLNTRTLAVACAATAFVLAAVIISAGSVNVGFWWPNFVQGFARVGFSFVAGMLIERVWRSSPRRTGLAFLPIALLVLAIVVPGLIQINKAYYDIAVVIIVFPLVVAAGAKWDLPRRAHRPASFFGEVSYPLYAIHLPLIYIMEHFTKRLMIPVAIRSVSELAILISAAYGAGLIDAWLRGVSGVLPRLINAGPARS